MRQFGLPKQCLIRKNSEFEHVYRHGRRLHGKGFSLVILENNRGYSRLGISVGRKIRGAVVRNRIKRIFKEAFRLNRDEFPQSSDIIIAVRPDFELDSPNRIVRAVQELMNTEST